MFLVGDGGGGLVSSQREEERQKETCENPMVPHLSQRAQTCPLGQTSCIALVCRGGQSPWNGNKGGDKERGAAAAAAAAGTQEEHQLRCARRTQLHGCLAATKGSGQIGAEDFSERAGRRG